MIEKHRIKWIDVAKGIGILSVIAGHFGNPVIGCLVFSYHLTVFFLLSGYTMKEKPLDSGYLHKLFLRLMVPYFVTAFSLCMMDVFNAYVYYGQHTNIEISAIIFRDIKGAFAASGNNTAIFGIDLGYCIGAIWFFPALFFAKILCQFLINKVSSWAGRFVISTAIYFLAWACAKFVWLPFSILSGLMAELVLMVGYYLKAQDIVQKLRARHYVGLSGILSGIFLYGWLSQNVNIIDIYYVDAFMPDPILSTLASLSATILVIGISRILENSRILGWFGRNSLTIMCAHLFALNTLGIYLEKYVIPLAPWNTKRESLGFVAVGFLCHVAFCSVIAIAVKQIGRWTAVSRQKNSDDHSLPASGRDLTIDLFRAVLIIWMLIGHVDLDPEFRTFIYSIHMMAFVLTSGYFYKPIGEIAQLMGLTRKGVFLSKVRKTVSSLLLPYMIFGILFMAIYHYGNIKEAITLILGMSFPNKIKFDSVSVGPVYFILMLAVVRLVYLLLDYIADQRFPTMAIMVTGLSLAGVLAGVKGYWLPWSFDCAMYSLVFYYVGILFRKFGVFEYCKKNPWTYFCISPIWMAMIYMGGMELATRNYGVYGLTLAGSLAGIIVVYVYCFYLNGFLLSTICKIFYTIGKSTMWILIIHTLFGNTIINFFSDTCGFVFGNIANLIFSVSVQLFAGCIIATIISTCKRFLASHKMAHGQA